VALHYNSCLSSYSPAYTPHFCTKCARANLKLGTWTKPNLGTKTGARWLEPLASTAWVFWCVPLAIQYHLIAIYIYLSGSLDIPYSWTFRRICRTSCHCRSLLLRVGHSATLHRDSDFSSILAGAVYFKRLSNINCGGRSVWQQWFGEEMTPQIIRCRL